MGAELLLAANLGIATLLAAAFMAIALYDDTRLSARWFSLGYFLGAGFFAIELATPVFGGGLISETAGFVTFLAALVAFNTGVSRFYDVRQPVVLIAIIVAAGIAAKVGTDHLPRESFARMMIYQAPYFALQAMGGVLILMSRYRRHLDTLLATLLGLSALHYVAKPFLARLTGGPGATPADYTSTLYAQIAQATASILAVGVALLLLVILVRNLFAELTERSETDLLSQVYNRRGFEQRLKLLDLRGAQPVALVLCDLDHFKTINDTYGHEAGDRAIHAFAAALKVEAGPTNVVGRIGGEEFAVILFGHNQASARLFAENVRAKLTMLELEDLPRDRRITASFGVAERVSGEDAGSLHRRTDAALYAAKNAGRDCVRPAAPRRLEAVTSDWFSAERAEPR